MSAAQPSRSNVERLNALEPAQAENEFQQCCGSKQWVQAIVARRPFIDEGDLVKVAREVWFGLQREDWLEAFSHHPRIGDSDALRAKFSTTRAWAENEQAGTKSASEPVLDALAGANQAYEQRFGYIFIVCATGLSAEEMLQRLEQRLQNAPDVEIRIAAEEQAKITQIRLQKLIAALGES